MEFDLVIRGGVVADGAGGEPVAADVAVRAGRIVQVGEVSGRGAEEIDARGRIVTPGFVDVHTHYDGQITWENRLSPSSEHGVTTVVMGNCGVGFAPCRPDQHDMLIQLMEGVEDIPELVMAEGVPWNWTSFPDYLHALSQRRADADFAAQLPHSALRVFAMGERGANLEPPTVDDLARMRHLTEEAVRAGALGVSTSRSQSHRFPDGRPAPSVNTEDQEIFALAQGLADAGDGVFQMSPNVQAEPERELAVMRKIIEISGRPLSFSLLDRPDRPDNWRRFVEGLKQAGADGLPIRAQYYPRPIGLLFGLDLSFHPFALNPSYRPLAGLPLTEKVAAMRDPAMRARLLAERPDDPNPYYKMIVELIAHVYPLGDPPDYNPPPERSAAARAARRGVSVHEQIYDDLLEHDGEAILYSVSTSPIRGYLDRAAALFDEPNAIIALGDGGAHYGMICDAAYPTFVLAEYVRKLGNLGLPRAVQLLSSAPALSAGLRDRGLIAPGYKADINVIDIDRVSLTAPRVRRDLPAGGKRLAQSAAGYDAIIVNGQATYRHGEPTDALPGRLVRGGGRQEH